MSTAARALESSDSATRRAEAGHAARPLAVLALSAPGAALGDLGTSPLYALQEAFHGARGVRATPENVFGIGAAVLWSLVLMVSVKYVAVLMGGRAAGRRRGAGARDALPLGFHTVVARYGFPWRIPTCPP